MTSSTVPGRDESAPLTKSLRAAIAVNTMLTRVGMLPRPEQLHLRYSVEKRRAMKPAKWMLLPQSTAVRVEKAVTASGVPLRIYRVAETAQTTGILYAHGGGFTVGGLDSCDWLCREFAVRGFTTVSVDYRLAPEDPYPAPLDDVMSGLVWLDENRDALGITHIAVGGDSAGGNLAAGLCVRVGRRGGPTIDRQLLIYPGLDMTLSSPSIHEPSPGLTLRDVEVSAVNYMGEADPTWPELSPLLNPDVSSLPPAIIITAEHDRLRDDGRRYAERLQEAGIPAFFRQYPGMPHGFLSLPKLSNGQATRAVDDMCSVLAQPA